jgi:hypothetical protein
MEGDRGRKIRRRRRQSGKETYGKGDIAGRKREKEGERAG